MMTQGEKAERFKALHERPGAFAIPNPWDAGSARLLAKLGFEALATTSAGFAFSIAKPDGGVTRDETLDNVRAIVAATDLPVSADLEKGFGDDPGACAETIRLGAEAGLVGGSIEDATGLAGDPIYAFDAAVARMRAAVKAARRSAPYAARANAPPTLTRFTPTPASSATEKLAAEPISTLTGLGATARTMAPMCSSVRSPGA